MTTPRTASTTDARKRLAENAAAPVAEVLTEDERDILRHAHWPIEPPDHDNPFQLHTRIELAVERIIAARAAAIEARP